VQCFARAEIAESRITQAIPHNSSHTLVYLCQRSW